MLCASLASLQLAEDNRRGAVAASDEAKAEVARLESELKAAKNAYGQTLVGKAAADDSVMAAENALKAVDQNAKLHEALQAAIDGGASVKGPDANAVLSAKGAVDVASKSLETAAVVRAAKERIARAKQHQEEAAKLRKTAHQLREAAKQTDDVLSAAVSSKHLKVKAGRLITTKESGRETFYADRSQGTRWMIALDEATARIRQLGAEGTAIIAAPQEAFESLDVENRRLIHEHACKLGVAILTAEAVGNEVAVVAYEPANDWKRNGELAAV